MSPECKSLNNNCGPDTEGDYCLFHKPDKNKEEAERFYEEIKKRGEIEEFEPQFQAEAVGEHVEIRGFQQKDKRLIFKGRQNWEGFVFPAVPENMDNSLFFSDSIFEGPLLLDDATFEGLAIFKRGDFRDSTTFKKTRFCEDAHFKDADFRQGANFWTADFKENAYFSGGKFHRSTSFQEVDFGGEVKFGGAVFTGEVDFINTRFGGEVSLSHTKFNEKAGFENTEFDKSVEFRDGRFVGEADFEGAKFNSSSNFKKGIFYKKADFSRVAFKGPVGFREAAFKGELNFESTHIQRGIDIEENTSYYGTFQAQVEAFRTLKQVYEENGEKNKADKMFVKERRSLRKLRWNKNPCLFDLKRLIYSLDEGTINAAWVEAFKKEGYDVDEGAQLIKDGGKWFLLENGKRKYRIEEGVDELKVYSESILGKISGAYRSLFGKLSAGFERIIADLTCVYGTNWIRLFSWAIGLIFVFGFFYFLGNQFGSGIEGAATEPIASLGDSLYYSVVTFTTLGYGDLQPVGPIMKFLSTLQSFLGGVFMALIVLVFARKWMR